MSNNLVMTCGSNEFGQLGLVSDATAGDGVNAQGGKDKELVPALIEKSVLDNVVYVAAGRYHTMVIRKQTEGDILNQQEEENKNSG